MHLVQLFLPLYDNDGRRFGHAHYERVRDELLQRFGGLTVHAQAPVQGLWSGPMPHGVCVDELLIHEVMVDGLDAEWWGAYRRRLEHEFGQVRLLVRAQEVHLL